MIKLFIVSNAKNKELAKFLEQRGTFSVVGSYNSISENAVNIQNDILKVDKTLYLYQVDSNGVSNINIRSDMQYLQRMLETNSFFDPGEIVFMTQNNAQCKQAIKYFMSVMESCNYKKYSIKSLDGIISYMSVYDNLMGNSESANFENQYRSLYRKEKDEESTIAYNLTHNEDDRIEPFNFRNLKDYDDQKKLAAKTMASVKFRDSSEIELDMLDNPVFNSMTINSVLEGPDVFILTGKSKSGLSVWTSALACSAFNGGRKVLVLDYTSNSDILDTLNSNNVDANDLTMKDMLKKEYKDKDAIQVVSAHNDREEKIKLNFIRKIFSDFDLTFDCIFIASDSLYFDNIVTMLRGNISAAILTTVPRHSDVVELQKLVDSLTDLRVLVVLNECLELQWDQFLTQQEVKDLLMFMNPKVVKSIYFDTVNVSTNLYDAIANA